MGELWLVVRFAWVLWRKLVRSRKKYGFRWGCSWNSSLTAPLNRAYMHEHIKKGDPIDVAAYCAFAWRNGWSLKSIQPSENPYGRV